MTAFVANLRLIYFMDQIDSSSEVPISNPSLKSYSLEFEHSLFYLIKLDSLSPVEC